MQHEAWVSSLPTNIKRQLREIPNPHDAYDVGLREPKSTLLHLFRALASMVLKGHISIFSITNAKKHAAMVEAKLKILDLELQ